MRIPVAPASTLPYTDLEIWALGSVLVIFARYLGDGRGCGTELPTKRLGAGK